MLNGKHLRFTSSYLTDEAFTALSLVNLVVLFDGNFIGLLNSSSVIIGLNALFLNAVMRRTPWSRVGRRPLRRRFAVLTDLGQSVISRSGCRGRM